jgi:hypothetical protein
MPNKTLIVGLGSTGAEIASRAIDRIAERLGSLENAPWVQVLALDTATVERKHSVAATGNTLSIALPETEFEAFKLRPGTLTRIDFEDWSDPAPFLSMNSSTQGAGNCRMIGRATMLYPDMFRQVHDELTTRLTKLSRVDLPAEIHKRGIESDNPQNDYYTVFVVGSLVGGTCSGTFIDIGYYLRDYGRTFIPTGGQFKVVGIFSAPHASYGDSDNAKRQMGNVYAALTELNHFLTDGVKFSQRYAMDEKPVEFVGAAPFHATHIVVPRSKDAREVDLAHFAVGDFVAASTLSDMIGIVETKLIDPSASLAGIRHKGRHLNFATIGIGILEYPAAQIRRACSERLMYRALKDFAEARIDPGDPEAFVNSTLGLSLEGLRNRLLSPYQGEETLAGKVSSILDWAEDAIRQGNIAAVQEAEERIGAAFATSAAKQGSLEPNLINSTIAANLPNVRAHFLDRVATRLDEALLNHREGPNWCARLLEVLEQRCKQIEDQRTGPGAHQNSGELLNGVNKQKKWVSEAKNQTLGLFRGTALAYTSRSWRQVAQRYWEQRINEACGTVEKDLLLAIQKLVQRASERLNGPNNPRSLVRMLEREIKASHQAELDLSVPPVVNGICEFDGAIDKAYRDSMEVLSNTNEPGLEGLHGEAFAKAKLIRAVNILAGSLHQDRSDFDPPVASQSNLNLGAAESRYRTMMRGSAVQLFEAATNKDVIAEVYGSEGQKNSDAGVKIKQLWSLSEPMVQIDQNDAPLAPAGSTADFFTPAFAFYYQAKDPEFPYGQFGTDLDLPINRQVKTSDKTKAIVVRARLGFSAEQMKAVKEYREGAEWWDRHSEKRVTLHARRDIPWYPLDGSELKHGLTDTMDLALLGMATGIIKRINSPHAPYLIEVPLADRHRPLRLQSDLEWMAYDLLGGATDDNSAAVYLKNEIKRKCAPASMPQLIQDVRHFLNHHTDTHGDIRYRNSTLEFKAVEGRLLRALDRFPGALEKYHQTYKNPDMDTPDTYYRPARGGKPEGYYCDGKHRDSREVCNRYLMAPTADSKKLCSEFPEICPNCGKQLLTTGFNRFFPVLLGQDTVPDSSASTPTQHQPTSAPFDLNS